MIGHWSSIITGHSGCTLHVHVVVVAAAAVDDGVAGLEIYRALLAGSRRATIGRPLTSLLIHGLATRCTL